MMVGILSRTTLSGISRLVLIGTALQKEVARMWLTRNARHVRLWLPSGLFEGKQGASPNNALESLQ